MDSKENAAGRFIQCSVADEDGKRHRLFFPEGDGLINGWSLLGEALQDLVFKVSRGEKRESATNNHLGKLENTTGGQIIKQSCEDARVSGNYQDALWLDFSDYILKEDLVFLKDGVVGSWKSKLARNMTPSEMEVWAKKAWRLKGNMICLPLNQNLFFMSFDLPEEADWVMENGSRICRGEALILERWNPSTGCMRSKSQSQEVWIRVVGLPLHLWTENILVTIGNSCGGFVAIDKETSLMKNLFWARILVRMKSHGRPTTVNLLAGGRSYEIQIWWEIQPRVTEVYPCRFSRETEMVNPREEDERNRRAPRRVNEERGANKHNFRAMHREVGQWQALQASGTEGILSQKLNCGGTTREGAKPQGEIQKIADENRSEEGTKLLRDAVGRDQGFHNGIEMGQSPGRSYGAVVGQSPVRINGVAVGQSPCQKMRAVRSTGTSRWKNQESDSAGRLGEIERGSESLNLAKHQNPDILGVEEVGGQKMCRNGRKSTRDVGGNQIEKEISHHKLNRELKNGKNKALISVDSKIGGEKEVFSGGERNRSSHPLPTGGHGELNFEMGWEINACRTPNSREGRSSASKAEEEGDDNSQEGRTEHPGTKRFGKIDGSWSRLQRKSGRIIPVNQGKENIGVGPANSMDRGSTAGVGPVFEMGQAQGRALDSDRPNQTSTGPNPCCGASLQETGYCGPNGSNEGQIRYGLSQEMQLWSPLQQNHRNDDQSQEEERLNNHRHDDNRYEKSPSSLISVFGRPLLPGDNSGLGGFNGKEDLEPLRVVAADGREWGVNFSGEVIDEGEGLAIIDQKTNESYNESSEHWTYENWEKSCLAKFSDFLGFPIMGFEKEITGLLRNLVNAQKLGKGKECPILSRSERELRKLEWTINYKGKESSREDGRNKGKLFLKLK